MGVAVCRRAWPQGLTASSPEAIVNLFSVGPSPVKEGVDMAAFEEQMVRIGRTADDLAAALKGHPETAVSKRPAEKPWAAKEVVCHLRDIEELFYGRLQAILWADEPKFWSSDPDAWAETRRYLADDLGKALADFRAKRAQTLRLVGGLPPGLLDRTGIHPTRGKVTVRDLVGVLAWHDDNHLDQIKRALEGKP